MAWIAQIPNSPTTTTASPYPHSVEIFPKYSLSHFFCCKFSWQKNMKYFDAAAAAGGGADSVT